MSSSDIHVAIRQGDHRCAHCQRKAEWIIGAINPKEEGTGMAKRVCVWHFVETAKSVERILEMSQSNGNS